MRRLFGVITFATVALLAPAGQSLATAQPAGPMPPTVATAMAGACTVYVDVPNAAASAAAEVDIDLNGLWIARQPLDKRPRVAFRLNGPLQHLDKVRARVIAANAVGDWGPAMEVQPGTGEVQCTPANQVTAPVDQRDGFSATFYVGGGFDNFAPAEVRAPSSNAPGEPVAEKYANPTAGGTSPMHSNAGVDFAFRIGNPASSFQFWITGETVHTVQSADLDCTTDEGKRPPICESLPLSPNINPTDSFLFALEHATALEAYLTPRFEFATFQEGSESPAKLYATFRLGVNTVTDRGHDAFDTYHVGAGLMAIGGPFEGSYLEAGFGRSDLFFVPEGTNKWRRLKFDALMSFPILEAITSKARFWRKAPHVYVQLFSDFDPTGASSDSVQTFIGLDFDMRELVRW